MGCLLCGKEIGPLRLLRDDEFCSASHRKQYKDRLGRALSSICAPEPPPAGIAGFRTELQPISGRCAHASDLENLSEQAHAIRFRIICPVAIEPVLGGNWKTLSGVRVFSSSGTPAVASIALASPRLPNLALDLLREAEPACTGEKVPGAATVCQPLPPEPVERFIVSAVALDPISARRTVSTGAGLPAVKRLVPGMAAAAASPAASEVQRWIEPAAALEPKHTAVPLAPRFALEATPDMPAAAVEDPVEAAPLCERWMPVPAEAVETLVAWSAAAERMEPAVPAVRYGAGLPAVKRLTLGMAAAAASPAASEVQRWIEPVAALEPVHTTVPLAPRFALEATPDMPAAAVEESVETAPLCERWMPVPAEAVETLVAWSAAVEWREQAITAVSLGSVLAPVWRPGVRLPGMVSAPAAAPVESWIETAAALDPVHTPEVARPRFSVDAIADATIEAAGEPVAVVAAAEQWMPTPAAEPVESWRETAAALELSHTSELARPRFVFDAAGALAPLRVVASCERWMPVPAADPVTSLVLWSEAGTLAPEAALAVPALDTFPVSDTFMPSHELLARPKAAEPAEVRVIPRHRAQSFAPRPAVLRGPDPIFDLAPDAASYVEGPRPQPVESMPAAQAVEPAARTIVPITAIRQSGLPEASCSYGYTPASHAPAPVESLVFPTFRASFMATIEVALPALALDDSRPSIALLGVGSRALPAARTSAAESRRPPLEPIRRLALLRPETRHAAASLAVAECGFSELEYYCQRPAGSITRNLELLDRPIVEITPPVFAIRPIFDRVDEEAAPPKKASKKLAMAEIFKMPEAKRKAASPAVHYVVKGIAAALLLGAVLWFGAGAIRMGSRGGTASRDVALIENAADNAPDSAASAAGASAPALSRTAPRAESMGAMARVRQVIAKRAAATVTDSFGNGMEAWGTPAKSWAPGWSHHSEGYVQPGQLALFRPSLNYTDYRLEFFGQIDNKSMGWTVRSQDPENYYAMKFSVVAPGLRPIIAMVHYSVVAGKKSRTTSTPLNVMVHNNTPIQVAVDVRGSRMVTSIDGQEVDTWIDDAIPSGGVGFFADAGEKSRLYWMKVSKNQDFVGRVCAYLSSALGSGPNARAEVWPPSAPGSAPLPGPSAPDGSREAAVAAAAVSFGSRRKSRVKVSKERLEPWNS